MSDIRFLYQIELHEKFRDLFHRKRYEQLLLPIINASNEIFKGKSFEYIEEQSNGECDFIDCYGEKYDAKLLFDQEQGALVGDEKNNLVLWIESMYEESCEFSPLKLREDFNYLENMKLYKVLKSRIETVNQDEKAILFMPYPVVLDFEEANFYHKCTDFLQAVFDKLYQQGYVKCKDVFFIYPSMEKDIYVLRDSIRNREFIKDSVINEYMEYKIIPSIPKTHKE